MSLGRVDPPLGIDAGSGADLASCALALARRFSRGATMWCLAPAWPEHARHVAVEFVHPVIVGKRALPAVSLETTEPAVELRALSRPGDVLLVAGPPEPTVHDVLRRAAAWGLSSVWIGAGARPEPGAADHVLWATDGTGSPRHDGRIVLLYHVLWELTHVCFEHPGLLATAECGPGDVCVTCSDEGRLGEIVAVGEGNDAVARTATGSETIDTTLVGAVRPGDLVLVHAGAAIALVEAREP